MVEKRTLAALFGIAVAVAVACDGKRTADDDEDGRAGDGGEGDAPATGGKGGGAGKGSGGKGGAAGGSAGAAARGGDGMGESGAPSTGGSGGGAGDGGTGGDMSSGGTGGNGGTAGDVTTGGNGGTGGDAGSGGSLGGTGGGSGSSGGAAGSSAGKGGTAGTGGTTGKGGTGGGAGTGGGGAAGAGSCGNLIDDMEAGTGYVCQGNGRTGSWFSYGSTYSTFNPPGYPVPTTLLASPRGSSTRAMRAYGTNDDYAGFGCWLVTSPATYDGSAYTGIRFYAMGTPTTLRVIGQTTATESTTYGGTCTLPTLECDGNETTITISSTWALYEVPWSSLVGGTEAWDPTDIWSIEFQPGTVGAYDFSIDDLSFY